MARRSGHPSLPVTPHVSGSSEEEMEEDDPLAGVGAGFGAGFGGDSGPEVPFGGTLVTAWLSGSGVEYHLLLPETGLGVVLLALLGPAETSTTLPCSSSSSEMDTAVWLGGLVDVLGVVPPRVRRGQPRCPPCHPPRSRARGRTGPAARGTSTPAAPAAESSPASLSLSSAPRPAEGPVSFPSSSSPGPSSSLGPLSSSRIPRDTRCLRPLLLLLPLLLHLHLLLLLGLLRSLPRSRPRLRRPRRRCPTPRARPGGSPWAACPRSPR
ncbi:hypothetical protein GGR56DRAFT_188915 [Xylariaceae sp. FL0804]|nr:hypothetical protein GGR56DRAFT_188915 [Xylariaceae sp. FL0804]